MSTVAGSGKGWHQDGACFYYPTFVALDQGGSDMIVSDGLNHRITHVEGKSGYWWQTVGQKETKMASPVRPL